MVDPVLLCPAAASIADHLIYSFLYDGSTKDIAINYTLLLLNIFVASSSMLSTTTLDTLRKRRQALTFFVSAVLFQITLCLKIQYKGISIWCAIMGWLWMDRKRELKGMEDMKLACTFYQGSVDIPNALLLDHENIVLGVDLLVLCYYAMVSEPITTVARIVAIVAFGIPSYYIMEMLAPEEGPRTLRFSGCMRQHSQRFLEANLSGDW